MTNREIYEAALSLLAEEQDELSADYEARAPYILRTFFCECAALSGGCRSESEGSVDLDDEFPLPSCFFSAGAYYLAAVLVENENDGLCDRYFARYAALLKTLKEGTCPGVSSSIRDVYGFRTDD